MKPSSDLPTTLTRDEVREVDRVAIERYGFGPEVLMENAGRGCTDVLCTLGAAPPVVIVCGGGNNGGDGFVVARHLAIRGIACRVVLLADAARIRGEARHNLELLEGTSGDIVSWGDQPDQEIAALSPWLERTAGGARWLVDALLGTGARGVPRPPLDRAIEWFNRQPAQKLAIDIPSGIDCDTGDVPGEAVAADHTCTFVAAKPGLLRGRGAELAGTVHVLDIGVPPTVVASAVGK